MRYNPEDGSGYYLWIEQIKQSRASGYKLQASGLKNLNYNITLEKKTKGKSTILQDTIYTNTLRWFIIEVMVDGDRIEVSMDGKKMIRVRDSEIQKGKIALITVQRLPLTVIDDFVVRPMQKKGFFSKITDKDEGTEAQRHKELQASSKKAASLRLQDSSYMPNSQRVKWQDSSQGTGPNPENDYETYNFELETLNHKLSNSSTPEPVLHVLPFSPISHFSPEPDPLYQTTSSLPPSELVYYYHHDHLGNIRAVTDQNKNVVERHDFYPFGEEVTTPQSKDQ